MRAFFSAACFTCLAFGAVSAHAVSVTTTSLPTGAVAEAYSGTLSASGGTTPYRWNVAQDYAESIETNAMQDPSADMDWNADSEAWLLDLPFTFPFYGVGYTQCWVAVDGYVHFATNYLDSTPTTNELAQQCMIAADWKDLDTSAGGDLDIYIWTNDSSCVIRWYGRTPMWQYVGIKLEMNENGLIRVDMSGDEGMMSPRFCGLSAGNGVDYVVSTNNDAWLDPGDIIRFQPEDALPTNIVMTSGGELYGTPWNAGTNSLTFRVTDATNGQAAAALDLVVTEGGNAKPVVSGSTPAAGAYPMDEAETNTFSVAASDPDGTPLSYAWTLDGTAVGTNSASYDFGTPWGGAGVYTLLVEISDDFWTNGEVSVEWTVAVTNDNDGDGMLNEWERTYGLDPEVNDSGGDGDGDGLSNIEEHDAGTDPGSEDTDNDTLYDDWELEYGYDPTSPSEILPGYTNYTPSYGYNLSADAEEVYVTGTTAYVACDVGGLKVIDCSDPDAPVLIDMHEIPGRAEEICGLGPYVFVGADNYGLTIFDASTPSNLAVLCTWTNAHLFYGPMAAVGDRLYVAQNSDLTVLSISDPASPVLLGQLDVSNTNHPAPGSIRDVAVRGDYAYCANFTEGLKTVNISDPETMVITATNEYEGVGVCEYAARGLDIEGDTLFMCQDGYGLMAFDLSDPASPALIDNFISSHNPFPYDNLDDVDVEGTNAYVIGGKRFWIYGVSDPSNMVELAHWQNGSGGPTDGIGIHDVDAEGDFVHLPTGWGTYTNAYGIQVDRGGLRLMDVTDKAAPEPRGRFITSGQGWDMEILNDVAYVANYHSGVHIVNVTNWTRLGRYDTEGIAMGIDVTDGGDTLLVADGENGLVVLDATDPANMALQSHLDTDDARAVRYLNGRIYVADYTNGLLVATNLSVPTLQTNFFAGSPIQGLTTYGSKVYAAAGGLGVYSVYCEEKGSNETWHTEHYNYTIDMGKSASAYRLEAADGRLWVADNLNGVVAIDISSAAMSYEGLYTNGVVQNVFIEDHAPTGDYIWIGGGTNITSFRVGDPIDRRNTMSDEYWWQDPEIKDLWFAGTNGIFLGATQWKKYEYGLRSFNTTRVDADEDGMADSDEMRWWGSTVPGRYDDTDGDGLSNWGESTTGTDPSLTDTDGDGVSDRDEYIAGTDPMSDGSCFSMDLDDPVYHLDLFDEFVLRWPSRAGRVYDLYRYSDLGDPSSRVQLLTNAPATPPMNIYTDTVFRIRSYMYRINVERE
ncbi:hypothetical protein [Kiritimatiella glycovorans]|uniref:Uncharacterized protein n=1 Tax=Kiritimatiella glycovorans TaxID=1307763 RepID=A0A0G3EG89_9BACT|nr:hypothetical protein [Kiritimatiella glycovorans]AKJ64422.1 hypothetical protein L21SP4_01173 [Kiritimatiella glycovorans]